MQIKDYPNIESWCLSNQSLCGKVIKHPNLGKLQIKKISKEGISIVGCDFLVPKQFFLENFKYLLFSKDIVNLNKEWDEYKIFIKNKKEEILKRKKINPIIHIKKENNETNKLEIERKELQKKEEEKIKAINNHRKNISLLGIKYNGISPTLKKHRTPNCYACKTLLDNSINIECNLCNWIICNCGACGCGFDRSRI